MSIDIKKKSKKNYYEFNLSNYSKFSNLLNTISKKYGKIYSIINCTYPKIFQKKELLKINSKLFDQEVYNDIGIYFNVMKDFSNYLIKKDSHGVLINFSSIYGNSLPRFEIYSRTKMTMPIQYAVSKNAINIMTRYYAKYLNKKNIKFFIISPGGVHDNQNKIFIKKYSKFTNKGLINKNDLISLVNFLLSGGANKMQGNNF